MCSATVSDQDSPRDSTADRLVDTACALISESGVAATSLRSVARSAGVSAPLVVHHFGSKAGLVAACDARVCEAVDDCMSTMRDPDRTGDLIGSWMELLGTTPYLGYITQSLRDGGTAGSHLFDHLYEMSCEVDTAMRSSGVAQATDDPEMRALLMMALDMGMLLLSEHVERVLGGPIESPEIAERWVRGALEILTDGVLVEGITPSPTSKETL